MASTFGGKLGRTQENSTKGAWNKGACCSRHCFIPLLSRWVSTCWWTSSLTGTRVCGRSS